MVSRRDQGASSHAQVKSRVIFNSVFPAQPHKNLHFLTGVNSTHEIGILDRAISFVSNGIKPCTRKLLIMCITFGGEGEICCLTLYMLSMSNLQYKCPY